MMTNDTIPHFTVIVDHYEYGRIYHKNAVAVQFNKYDGFGEDGMVLTIYYNERDDFCEPTWYSMKEIRGFAIKQSIQMDKKGGRKKC